MYWSRKAVGRAGMLRASGCQEQLVGRALVAPAGLPAWALALCHSMAIQMALVPSTRPGDLLGQGGVPSTTPDGLRHPLK